MFRTLVFLIFTNLNAKTVFIKLELTKIW